MKPRRAGRVYLLILCEDDAQRRFFEGLCSRHGVGARDRRIEFAPPGRGDASQWVRARYAERVKVFRAVAARRQGGLLVAIDGDDKGVTTRKSELEEALKAQAALPRAADEAIAVCVPTWSIETWLAWLCGWEHVDESTPYKAHAAYQQAARRGEIDTRRALDAWMSGPRSGEAERVPSLAEGRRETTRLPL